MIKQLTKEVLLARVQALPDGAELDAETIQILTCPYDDEYAIETIKRLNRIVHGTGKYDRRVRHDGEKPAVRNDIVKMYVETHENAYNVDNVLFGLKPDELDNPVDFHGIGAQVRLREQGYFAMRPGNVLMKDCHTPKDACKCMEDYARLQGWKYVYIYAVTECFGLTGWGANTGIGRNYIARMTGLTEEMVEAMRKEGDERGKITWLDYASAAGININSNF